MREFGAARAHRCDFAAAFFVVSFARASRLQIPIVPLTSAVSGFLASVSFFFIVRAFVILR